MTKKGRKKLNEFIAEYDGFTSIKSISKKQVEFTYSDGSKKILDFQNSILIIDNQIMLNYLLKRYEKNSKYSFYNG